VSPWSNSFFFKRPYDVLITSDEIFLSQGDNAVASAVLPSPAAAQTFEARIGQTIKAVIAQVPGRKAHSTHIWLSHSLVSHSVVQMDARAMSDADISSAMKAYWEDTLDRPAAKLVIANQVQARGRSIFSSCCDLVLIDAIQAALEGTGCKPASIAPHFVKTWNEGRKQIPSDDCYLLVLQDKVLSIGRHQGGQWVAWTSEGCDSTEWAELAFRCTRFSRSTGLADGQSTPVLIHAPQTMGKPRAAGLSNWSLLNAAPHAAPQVKASL
jgi:hypothetical protein